MNNLSILNPNQQTMSTREIAKLLGKQHCHIKISAERLAASGTISLRGLKFEHKGNEYEEYHLNKRDSIILVAQNCPEFTAAIVERWQELEGATAKALSSSANIDYMVDSAVAEFKLNLVQAVQKTISYQLKKGLPERQSSKPEPLSNDEIKDIATSLYFDGKHPAYAEPEDSESGIPAIKRKTIGKKVVWRLLQHKMNGNKRFYCIDSTCSGDLIKAVKKLILLEIKHGLRAQ
jgi:hypothetical protein